MSSSKRIQATAADPHQPPRVLTAREQRVINILDTLSEETIAWLVEVLEMSLARDAGPRTQH